MASRQADWVHTLQAWPLEGLAAAGWRAYADRKLSASLAPLVSVVQREEPVANGRQTHADWGQAGAQLADNGHS
jgi:hypothetical protein